MARPGCVIFLNGASSSGKTTLARALQSRIELPFWHYSIDHYRDAGILPMNRIRSGEFTWARLRQAFFGGFHASVPALVGAGNNMILEHIVEDEGSLKTLVHLLAGIDVFFVGVHCSLSELERRELTRGNRSIGDARKDFAKAHAHCVYDLELDSTDELHENVETLCKAWVRRSSPSAFQRLLSRYAGPASFGDSFR